MHRRAFIKQTGAAALAVTATGSSGRFVHAGDKGFQLVQFRARFSTTAAPHGFMSVRSRVALRSRPRKGSLSGFLPRYGSLRTTLGYHGITSRAIADRFPDAG